MKSRRDTIRILVSWKCNLKCDYCCNEQERFRKDILPVKLDAIDFSNYENVCISGGEPLLHLERVVEVMQAAKGKFQILYTNGLLLNNDIVKVLEEGGVKAVNIGLHYPSSFSRIINKAGESFNESSISVRFHVWEKYRHMVLEKEIGPRFGIKYWQMDDCERENEDRVVLI